jgi:hypothetical protein
MGYLDKTTQTVTAQFTKRGREVLANALSGTTDDSYVITKFALGDDEIDYGLWDETEPSNLKGRVIDNMPLLEGFINQKEIMNSFITDVPETSFGPTLSNLQNTIILTGQGDSIDISPFTENFSETEVYEFFLEHDNLFEMVQPWLTPISDFTMIKINEGSSSSETPPISSFTMSII